MEKALFYYRVKLYYLIFDGKYWIMTLINIIDCKCYTVYWQVLSFMLWVSGIRSTLNAANIKSRIKLKVVWILSLKICLHSMHEGVCGSGNCRLSIAPDQEEFRSDYPTSHSSFQRMKAGLKRNSFLILSAYWMQIEWKTIGKLPHISILRDD